MNRITSALLLSSLVTAVACGDPEPPKAPSDVPPPAPAMTTPPPPPAATAMPDPKPADPPPADAAKPPMTFTLGETPDDKLGTAPAGFGLAVGTKAPDATLDDVTGKKTKLSDLYKAGPVFVVFYRGGWCPFCNLQLHQLADAKADFDKHGVKLVAISVDKPSEEAKTQAKDGIPFPMLSDPKMVSLKAFKVVHQPSPEEQKALIGFGVDLESYSGEKHHDFSVPSIFLVDKTGTIKFAHVDQDFKSRPSPKQLLAIADKVMAK